MLWGAKASHYQPLIERIIAQSERRVLKGEQVPVGEKLVSLFEPHADILVKGGRDTSFGHKLNLVTGRSGLVLDVVIEAGNPADSDRRLRMLERNIAFYAQARGRQPPMAALRAMPISIRLRPAASATWPSIRSAAFASKIW